jgi:hypothetical protein
MLLLYIKFLFCLFIFFVSSGSRCRVWEMMQATTLENTGIPFHFACEEKECLHEEKVERLNGFFMRMRMI